MASQNAEQTAPFTPSSHASILIRMKRKRHAPPLESFVVETNSLENTILKEKHKTGERSKTIFTRASSVDMTSPITSEMARMLGGEAEKQILNKDDIGGKMKKLKLGGLEAESKEITSTIEKPKPKPILTDSISNNPNVKNVQVFDISKDVKTETLSIQSVAAQASTGNPIVTCNGDKMTREVVTHQGTDEHNYVYDLYYTEDADLSMFDDPTAILINPLDYDITWTDPLTDPAYRALYDEDYNDNGLSDDSNEEDNWRNEYGEEPDSDSEIEIDRMHCSKYGVETGEYDLNHFDDSGWHNNINWANQMGDYHLKHEKDLYYYDNDES